MPRLVVGREVVEVLSCSSEPKIFPMLGKLGNSLASAMLVGCVAVTRLTSSLGLTVGRNSFNVLSVVVFSLKSSLLTRSLANLTGCFPELTERSGTAGLGVAGEDLRNSESVRSSNLNLKLSLEKSLFSSPPVFVFWIASNNAIILSDKCSPRPPAGLGRENIGWTWRLSSSSSSVRESPVLRNRASARAFLTPDRLGVGDATGGDGGDTDGGGGWGWDVLCSCLNRAASCCWNFSCLSLSAWFLRRRRSSLDACLSRALMSSSDP